jgi:hypothetical protein
LADQPSMSYVSTLSATMNTLITPGISRRTVSAPCTAQKNPESEAIRRRLPSSLLCCCHMYHTFSHNEHAHHARHQPTHSLCTLHCVEEPKKRGDMAAVTKSGSVC